MCQDLGLGFWVAVARGGRFNVTRQTAERRRRAKYIVVWHGMVPINWADSSLQGSR